MKSEMKTSLERGFTDSEENERLLILTVVDPRFKQKFYRGPLVTQKAKSLVRDKITSFIAVSENPSDGLQPPPKWPC